MLQGASSALDGFELELPLFPLNTDGIDASGRNYTFRNLKITNFDDAVVPKPTHQGKSYACTEDILVEHCEVTYGVGMSIGSVPPNLNTSCVKDITFRDISFKHPFKAIYVKTNPGKGDGMIKNITYQDITIDTPIWWGVYIGP